MLAALMLPFASQAQELTVHDGTTTNGYVPVYGFYADAYLRSQFVYPADELSEMVGGSISSMTFYASEASVDWGSANFEVKMTEISGTSLSAFDESTSTSVFTGSLSISNNQMTVTFTTPYPYNGGNLLVEVDNLVTGSYVTSTWLGETVTGASVQGYNYSAFSSISGTQRNFLPKTTFTYEAGGEITCTKVFGLAIDTITNNSMTFHWSDTNSAASFRVYAVTATDTTLISGPNGITDSFYTVNGLDANTVYTFGVKADCGETDGLSTIRTVTGRTACGAVNLPYSMGFESADLPSGSNVLPYCWARYNSAGSFYPYAQSNTTYSTYSRSGSNCLNFYMGNGSSYADTVMAILPLVNVTTYPMNNNELRFWARTTSTSASIALQIGTLTDPEDPTTFVLDQEITVSGNTYMEYEALLGVNSTGAYPAIRIFKPESTVTVYIDDLLVEVRPSCLKPLVTATPTSSSVNLSWEDANTDATYSIIKVQGTDSTYTTTTESSYLFEELPENTNYTFIVRALCSADDSSRAATLATRTLRSGHVMTAFNLTGTGIRRDAPVMDTMAEPYAINAPVWYTNNLASATISWSLPTSAAVFIDTTGDGSYTCQVTTTTIKNYLRMNVPIVLRVKAEDRALYTDYTLTLVTEDCVKDRNLTFNAERIRYTAVWDNPDTMVITHYFVNSDTRLTAEDLAGVNPVIVNNAHQVTVEGLNRATKYYAYLKAACDTTWIEDSVTTQDLGACLDVVIADGTGTNSYVPLYGNYAERHQRIQSIYPASMLVNMMGVTISDIHYFVSSGSSANWGGQTWEVSLGITEQENLQSGWVDTTILTRVYTGTLSASVADGMTIVFDQPFTYTGGNLVVQFVQRNPNSYTSCTFRGVTSGVSNASRYAYPANTDDLWAAAGSTANFLPKFNFTYCLPANACPDVTNITVDSLTNTSALIEWTASDADYCVGNKIIVSPTELDSAALANVDGAIPLAADAVSYSATGLIPDHDYYVYIKALCNGEAHPEGTSGWASYQFRTYPNVRVPVIVAVRPTGKHTAQAVVANTGYILGQPTNFSYILSTSALDSAALATATPTVTGVDTMLIDIDNLASATTYYLYFRNEMSAEVSPWSAPAVMTMPVAMPAIVNLTILNVSYNAMTAMWLPDFDQFANETAWRTAIVEHGQQPTSADWQTVTNTIDVADDSYGAYNLFVGLTPETAYDIYVAAYDIETGATSDTVTSDSVRTAKFPGNGIIVADGTTTNQYVLLRSSYQDADHRSQVIYPASMLTALQGKRMTAMRFYSNYVSSIYEGRGDWTENNFVLKLAVTANENLASAWDATEGDTVFNGSIPTIVEDGQFVFEFDTPIQYNGGNLLVELLYDDSFGNRYTSGSFYGMSVDNASRYANGSDALTTATGTVQNFLPKVMFDYEGASNCLPVSTVYVNDVTDQNANIMWYPGYEETAWDYVVSTSDSLTAAELEAAAIPASTNNVVLSGLVRDTNYTFYVRPVCSDTETGSWASWTYRTPYVDYYYDVIATVNDEAMGTVESLIGVLEGTDTILVAEANLGYHFVNWTMGETILGTNDTLEITVDSNMAIMANFAINDSVSMFFGVNNAIAGSIAPAGVQSFIEGTIMTITATPAEGYHLTGWVIIDDGRDTMITEGLGLTYTDTVMPFMDGASIYAVFAMDTPLPVEATIAASDIVYWVGTGSNEAVVAVNWADTAFAWGVRFNGSITVQNAMDTIANYDSRFNWTTNSYGLGDITFNEGEISLSGDPMSWWESKNNGASDAGLFQTLTNGSFEKWAQPAAGTWVGSSYWYDAAYGLSWMDNNVYTMAITPMWAPATVDSVTATFNVNDATMGTITPAGVNTFAVGEVVTVTATPNEGYHIASWHLMIPNEIDSTFATSINTYTDTVKMNWEGAVVTVNFAADSAIVTDSLTIVLGVNNPDLGTITPAAGTYVLALGDSITLTATPLDSNVFNGWLTIMDGEPIGTLPMNPLTIPAFENNVGHTMVMIAQFAAPGAAPDSLTVVINVNNAAMGTTTPAPGTYRVAVGDSLTLAALPNEGFRNLYWVETMSAMGMVIADTLAYDTLHLVVVPMMANATLTYTAYFATDSNMVTINAVSADTTMGTVTGGGVYEVGATVTLTATPKEGYHFVRWSTGDTTRVLTFIATEDLNIVAQFEANTGIDEIEGSNATVYSAESNIYVKGAENMNIYVYDVNGRCVCTQANATETVVFKMNTTGVYLVKVGNAPAKRVVVVR